MPDWVRAFGPKTAAALLCTSGMPLTAWACGSMGLDNPRTLAVLGAAIFVPMVALVPVEIGFLRWLGGLRHNWLRAYLACLPAKVAGVVLVAWAAQRGLMNHIVVAELTYSVVHLAVSLGVLGLGFQLRGRALVLTSVAISTVIPWLYSAALWTAATWLSR